MTFQDKHKLREFITTKSALQKIFKGILHTEEVESKKHTGSITCYQDLTRGRGHKHTHIDQYS